MSRTLKEIRETNKNNNSLINYITQDNIECSQEFIEQGEEEFENFIKPMRDRVFNRYVNKE